MFTGIVTERGRVVEVSGEGAQEGRRLVVGHSSALASNLDMGASLAVAGVCLTVVEQGREGRPDREGGQCRDGEQGREGEQGEVDGGVAGSARTAFDLSPETLDRTTLGAVQVGQQVNLEPPLAAGEPLGGHWVQGHVDTTTRVARVDRLGEHRVIGFEIPEGLERDIVNKGSITLDGVSLTVASLGDQTFDVALIPHTLEVTTLGDLAPGDRVNVEADVLGRYVRNHLDAYVREAVAAAVAAATGGN